MTRDELREQIAKLLWERFGFPEGQAAWHSTGLDVADRIVEIVKKAQPKLEWRETGLRGDFEELRLGNLVVGFIFKKSDESGSIGQAGARVELSTPYTIHEKARAAVEDAVRKALGWAE